MITYEVFKQWNRGWDGGICNRFSHFENWQEDNYQIALQVEKEFYKHYDQELMVPQRGDLLELAHYNKIYTHANVESVNKYGVISICENGSTWTNGKSFSTSGGGFLKMHRTMFEFVGYEERTFWTWGRNGSGGGQGIYFTINVKKFRQKAMVVNPTNKIYMFSPYYKERCNNKVVIMGDSFYIAQGFSTLKAFRAFADYIGLTYRKIGAGEYLCDQFIKDVLFWELSDLPDGCKPYHGWSNGSIVTCYAHNDGKTITFYRPNSNKKELWKPIPFEEYDKYRDNPMGV